MSYRFNSSNIIYICSIKQIERIVFEKPNEKNYNKYNIILSIMRRQVYKKVIEIAPDLKRQIAMEMGCTVDTVYNALNLSNPTTGAQPDRIRRRAMELAARRTEKSAGSIIDAPTSRANENSRKKEVVLQTATKSSTTSCFRTMLCANNAHRQKTGSNRERRNK